MSKLNEDSRSTKKGCLMLNFGGVIKNWTDIMKIIEPQDIYDDEEGDFGLEKDPHITILYGVSPDISHDEVKEFINSKVSEPIQVKLTEITMFENEQYDVLKFSVDSEKLHELNGLMRENFPYESNFPDYIPHMTIAYLKKGTGKDYVEKIKPIDIKSRTLVYSIGYEDKITWKIQ